MIRAALAVLAAATLPVLLPAQDKPPDYFPVAVGSRWVYKTTFEEKGGKVPEAFANVTTTKEIVKVEAKDGKTLVVFESQLDFGVAAPNKEKTREEVLVDASGVSSLRSSGAKMLPPLPMLKYPVKPGVIFSETAKEADLQLTTTVTVKDSVELTVPAGKFTAAVVETSVGTKDERIANTTWYASGVGIVKQSYAADRLTITLELTKYTPGK